MNLMNETTPHFPQGQQAVQNNDILANGETLNVIKPAELWCFLRQKKENEGEKGLPLLPFLNDKLKVRRQAP